MFDSYVINLARRPKRWKAFWQRFPADWPWSCPQRFTAIDGANCQIPDWFKAPIGAWGCYRSHVAIWRGFQAREWESLLVLEDDAEFCRGAVQTMRETLACVPDDWDQIYFGGQHLRCGLNDLPPEVVIPDKLVRCRYVNRTHAYLIRRRFAEAALAEIDKPSESTNGQDHHVDYRLGDMHASGRWNIYAPWRFCVGQAKGESDVRDNRRRKPQHVRAHMWNHFRAVEPAGVV